MSYEITDIVTDIEVERVHANANFGAMTKRGVVNDGVLKYAFGYSCGHTMNCILIDHGLVLWRIDKRPNGKLTAKGWRYFKALGPAVFAAMGVF